MAPRIYIESYCGIHGERWSYELYAGTITANAAGFRSQSAATHAVLRKMVSFVNSFQTLDLAGKAEVRRRARDMIRVK